MIVTTVRPTTARYYVGKDRTEHYTEAELPGNEVVFVGPTITDGERVVCEVTDHVHMVLDSTAVQTEEDAR